LTNTAPSPKARQIRAIALELERIANHIGDLGALAGDVAFLPTASFCGRIRGEYLNMTAELCGNRFGRGLVVPGGVKFDLEPERADKIIQWIDRVYPELKNALDLMFDCPTVLDRFENTGSVSLETAESIGLVGMAGRASGIKRDVRHDYPLPEYGGNPPAMPEIDVQGDVIARARIRYEEIKASHIYLEKLLKEVPAEGLSAAKAENITLKPDHIAVSVTEAWRGALCYAAVTGNDGSFKRVKIVDPSFHNWTGLAFALRGEQISHFPICNKSFNLSYCGYDL
jgi:Ni,Fe-hydrogenase III large subunit